MKEIKTTGTLTDILSGTRPSDFSKFQEENRGSLINDEQPFSSYMRETIKSKGLKQQDVFLSGDISEGYGYKLISGEKHTKKRDVILRLCLGGRFTLKETQTALKLYGFSPLYAKIDRDALLIIAINSGIYDVHEIDRLLQENHLEPVCPVKSIEE